MTIAELVILVLQLSIAVTVFTIGLSAAPRELTYLLRHPGKLVRSIVAMNLVMPVIAVLMVKLFNLSPPVEITLVALALSPVPPMFPKKVVKAGGGHAYVMSLLLFAGAFAIIWIPIAGMLLNALFPAEVSIPALPVAKAVLMTIFVPTVAGVTLRLLAPGLAERLARPLGLAATIALLGAFLLILFKVGPTMLALVGNGTLAAIAGFTVLGLAVGHLLGGPAPSDRTVLALGTAARHPAIAISIAATIFPDAKAVPAVVLIYLLVSALVTLPYVNWRKKTMIDDGLPTAPAATA